MIGLLVGALLDGLDKKMDWKLESVDAKTMHDFDTGMRLDTNRDAYGDLELVGCLVENAQDARAT